MLRTILALAFTLISGTTAFAAAGTPPKPDLSSVRFLVGSWSCKVLSDSEEPKSVGVAFSTSFALDPHGYWLVVTSVDGKRYLTYDRKIAKWVTTAVYDDGEYNVGTSPGWIRGSMKFKDLVNSGGEPIAFTTLTKMDTRRFTLESVSPPGGDSFKTSCAKT